MEKEILEYSGRKVAMRSVTLGVVGARVDLYQKTMNRFFWGCKPEYNLSMRTHLHLEVSENKGYLLTHPK